MPINAMTDNKINRQINTDRNLGTPFFSIHLLIGNSRVANIPPIVIGIRNPLAIYNPATSKNRTSNLFFTEEIVKVMSALLDLDITIKFRYQTHKGTFYLLL